MRCNGPPSSSFDPRDHFCCARFTPAISSRLFSPFWFESAFYFVVTSFYPACATPATLAPFRHESFSRAPRRVPLSLSFSISFLSPTLSLSRAFTIAILLSVFAFLPRHASLRGHSLFRSRSARVTRSRRTRGQNTLLNSLVSFPLSVFHGDFLHLRLVLFQCVCACECVCVCSTSCECMLTRHAPDYQVRSVLHLFPFLLASARICLSFLSLSHFYFIFLLFYTFLSVRHSRSSHVDVA